MLNVHVSRVFPVVTRELVVHRQNPLPFFYLVCLPHHRRQYRRPTGRGTRNSAMSIVSAEEGGIYRLCLGPRDGASGKPVSRPTTIDFKKVKRSQACS